MKLATSRLDHESPVSEQAAAWLAALSDEACTPEERRDFAQWLTRSNVHVEEFLRVSTLMRRLERTCSWPEADIDRLIAEARSQINVRRLPGFPGKALRERRVGWIAAAAALAGVAFLMLQAAEWWRDRQTYETKLGELRSVTLEDGSIVELNAKSGIRTRFTSGERRVDLLAGEAVFRVAQNHERPFKVSAPLADIIAVGTQFNVNSRADKTIVTVIEGRVKVLRQSETTPSIPVLNAGEQAVVQREQAAKPVVAADPEKVTGWTTRRLYFEDTPLAEAIGEFERYSTRRIRIDDPALAERRITGTFDSFDPAALVQFLARYGDTAIVESNDGWVVGAAAGKGKGGD